MNKYLIPANSKKGMLILSLFKPFDLVVLGTGVSATFLLFLILPITSLLLTILILLPGLISFFLVLPIPNYHNVLTFLSSLLEFYGKTNHYLWKGWIDDYDKIRK